MVDELDPERVREVIDDLLLEVVQWRKSLREE